MKLMGWPSPVSCLRALPGIVCISLSSPPAQGWTLTRMATSAPPSCPAHRPFHGTLTAKAGGPSLLLLWLLGVNGAPESCIVISTSEEEVRSHLVKRPQSVLVGGSPQVSPTSAHLWLYDMTLSGVEQVSSASCSQEIPNTLGLPGMTGCALPPGCSHVGRKTKIKTERIQRYAS